MSASVLRQPGDLNQPGDQFRLRSPSAVMRLERMGSFFPTRLSFMRTLLRRLHRENAVVSRPVWNMDPEGYGEAVYSVALGGKTYSLIAYSTMLSPEQRSDRVIAEAWDTSYALFDGIPSHADIVRLKTEVPRQEAGRCAPSELVLSRANKSVRLFEHVADRLSQGLQPDRAMIGQIGYLMRTTAVYGNGKFGIADRSCLKDREGLAGPFQAEMLTVWLIRGFTLDLVEHVARERNPQMAVPLAPDLRHYIGVGNSTGLGMAPFLVNHPLLLHAWMGARETALARVLAQPSLKDAEAEVFGALAERVRRHLEEWNVEDQRQAARINILRQEWDAVLVHLAGGTADGWADRAYPWQALLDHVAGCSVECQELMIALILEPQGALIDDLAENMACEGELSLNPAMTLGALASVLAEHFDWAQQIDFDDPAMRKQFWYVSEEKLEPRLGSRWEEPGAEREMPLDVAYQIQALAKIVSDEDPKLSVAEFLLRFPGHRHTIKRIQSCAEHPYSEIQDNLTGAACLPIDMLRCKLSFFGASKFDPKSDRWTRIALFQGAPGLDDVAETDPDAWAFPVLG